MTIAAIILAAGRGTRFGEAPKMLAMLHGKPLARHVAEAALVGGLTPLIVVVGHRSDEVEAAFEGVDATIVRNPNYADGLSTSLRAGFAMLSPSTDAAMILLGDMPLVAPHLLKRLADAWRDAGCPPALVPRFAGKRGNPVILSRKLGPEIAELTGDSGAGPILRGRADVVDFAVEDEAVAVDIDTPEALAALTARSG